MGRKDLKMKKYWNLIGKWLDRHNKTSIAICFAILLSPCVLLCEMIIVDTCKAATTKKAESFWMDWMETMTTTRVSNPTPIEPIIGGVYKIARRPDGSIISIKECRFSPPAPGTIRLLVRFNLADLKPKESTSVFDDHVYIKDDPLDFSFVRIDGQELGIYLDANRPYFVGIFGDDIKNEGCNTHTSYEPACIRDISPLCAAGICWIEVDVTETDRISAVRPIFNLNR
jgi:hypothetical protein